MADPQLRRSRVTAAPGPALDRGAVKLSGAGEPGLASRASPPTWLCPSVRPPASVTFCQALCARVRSCLQVEPSMGVDGAVAVGGRGERDQEMLRVLG